MANPDYATLLPLIAAETDPVLKQQLIDQCYQFLVPLTDAERELFEYSNFDYIENNPGYIEPYAVDGNSHLYVLPNYVVDGYINIENGNAQDLYVLAGYVLDGYIAPSGGSTGSGFVAYVGKYYNQDGETA